MVLASTLLCLLLFGNLLSDDQTTRRPSKGEPEEGRKVLTRNQNRQDRSVSSQCQEGSPLCSPTILKAFDFSADNDHEPDSNGAYTSATLDAGALPQSHTS